MDISTAATVMYVWMDGCSLHTTPYIYVANVVISCVHSSVY